MKNNLEQLNIPITEMMEILDFEIQQGYKVSWRVVEKFAIKKTFQKWWKSFTEDLNLITKVINDLAQLREFVNNVNEKCMVYKQAWLSTDVITQYTVTRSEIKTSPIWYMKKREKQASQLLIT